MLPLIILTFEVCGCESFVVVVVVFFPGFCLNILLIRSELILNGIRADALKSGMKLSSVRVENLISVVSDRSPVDFTRTRARRPHSLLAVIAVRCMLFPLHLLAWHCPMRKCSPFTVARTVTPSQMWLSGSATVASNKETVFLIL